MCVNVNFSILIEFLVDYDIALFIVKLIQFYFPLTHIFISYSIFSGLSLRFSKIIASKQQVYSHLGSSGLLPTYLVIHFLVVNVCVWVCVHWSLFWPQILLLSPPPSRRLTCFIPQCLVRMGPREYKIFEFFLFEYCKVAEIREPCLDLGKKIEK